ncbi:MAG: metallopeptidase TldD-related protein [Candidatus Helarchaeota archaeon]
MKDLTELTDLLVARLKAAQIPMWDVFSISFDIYENQFRKHEIEITRHAITYSYVLRTFYEKGNDFGVGVIKANSMDVKEIDTNIRRSQELAKLNVTPNHALPQLGKKYPTMKLAEDHVLADPEGVLTDQSEEYLRIVGELKHVEPTFGKLRLYISKSDLRNSEDLFLNDQKTSFYIEFPLKSEESGNLAEFWGLRYLKNTSQLNLQKRLAKWAELSVDSLRARTPPPTKSISVILSPKMVWDALSKTIGHHSTGVALYEGISRFKEEEKVADTTFTLIDNGLMEDGIFVANWDGEGNPQQATMVIQKGIFQNFLYDQLYATLKKRSSTGNGLRSLDGDIINSITNLEIAPGSQSLDELIEATKFGVFIEEFSWLNPSSVTGDFGAEIRNGYLIENGKISTPIKGGNLSGNAFEMIQAIEGITKDRLVEGKYKFPHIKFADLILSS